MPDLPLEQFDGDLSDFSRGLQHLGKQLYVVPEALEEEAQIQVPAMEAMREMPSTQVEEELIR